MRFDVCYVPYGMRHVHASINQLEMMHGRGACPVEHKLVALTGNGAQVAYQGVTNVALGADQGLVGRARLAAGHNAAWLGEGVEGWGRACLRYMFKWLQPSIRCSMGRNKVRCECSDTGVLHVALPGLDS